MDSFLSILPNLSIGVVSVLSLAGLSYQHNKTQKETQEAFIATLDDRATKHEAAMQERENALRGVEKEVRTELAGALQKSTSVIDNNAKVMERVVNHLDKQ